MKLNKIASFLLLVASSAFADTAPNLISINPGAENGKQGWTASGGTFAVTGTAANVGEKLFSFSFDASAGSQTVTSSQYTVPAGLFGRSCMGKFLYKGGDTNLKVQVIDGSSNVVAEQTLGAQTTFKEEFVTFICPSSGSLALRLSSSADAAIVYWDAVFVGENTKVGSVAQSSVYGTLKYAGPASCSWSSTSSSSFANFAADTDCPTPTTTGAASAPGTKVPGITFSNMPPGEYAFVALGAFHSQTSNVACEWRFSDGTSFSSSHMGTYDNGNTGGYGIVMGRISYTTAGSRTIQLQGTGRGASGECVIDNTSTLGALEISVYRYPTASSQVLSLDTAAWRVDANIAGNDFSLGTGDVSSYTGMTNAGQSLTNNSGNGVVQAQIACAGTTESSGSTCTAADESNGISFDLPTAGDALACVSFSHTLDIGATGTISTGFQIVETGNANQSIVQEGKSRILSRNRNDSASRDIIASPFRLCGIFSFGSVGKRTLRLFYEQDTANTVNASSVRADASALVGQPDVHWEVYPITQNYPMPVIVNSVSTENAGQISFNSAFVTGATATVVRQDDSWISSVSHPSAGNWTVNIASGVYSSTPVCTCTGSSDSADGHCTLKPTSTTAVTVRTRTVGSSPADFDDDWSIMCSGPR